jgi:hypothetical protein
MSKDEDPIIQRDTEQRDEMSEAEIDDNLIGTFPASDPPSWTLGTSHQEEARSEEDKSTSEGQED